LFARYIANENTKSTTAKLSFFHHSIVQQEKWKSLFDSSRFIFALVTNCEKKSNGYKNNEIE
jgi:hypothetical protein